MLQFLRKHTLLAAVLFGATIISFVVFMAPTGPTTGGGGPAGGDVVGTVYGKPFTRDEYMQALREARLTFFFRSGGEWPERSPQASRMNWDERQQALNRLVAIRKQGDLGLMVPDSAVIDAIKEVPYFQSPNEAASGFDKSVYEFAMTNYFPRYNISRESFQQFIRHELGMQRMSALVGTAGELVSPREAKEVVRREFRQAKTQLVVFKGSNYVDRIEIEPSELEDYYQKVQANYRLPERRTVSYVAFPFANFLAEAEQSMSTHTNLQDQIEAMYQNRGPESFRDDEGQVMPETAAKEQLREEILGEAANFAAKRAANDFARAVIEGADAVENPGVAFFESKAAEHNHTVQATAPFTQFQPPAGLSAGRDFATQAFKLNESNPYAMLEGEEAFYVIALNEIIPSEIRPLEEVRFSVENRLKQEKARERVKEEGDFFYTTLTDRITEGMTFAEAVREEGMEVVEPPPFSLQDRSIEGFDPTATGVRVTDLINATFSLTPGENSGYMASGQNGFILHLEEYLDVPSETVEAEYPSMMEDMRRQRRMNAFSEWFNRELQLAQPSMLTASQSESEEADQ